MKSSAGAYMPILETLIAFPTVSSASNVDLIGYVEEFLAERGFRTDRDMDPSGEKANLIAVAGPQTEGGIMLAGHTDVVPVEGQHWTNDPFRLTEKAGYLYGRGTADMKGFLALVMGIAADLDVSRLERPLVLVFTYDEEVGCRGAKALEQKLEQLSPRPRFAIVGEPTSSALATAHKGLLLNVTRIRGRPAHSSRPDIGANAIVCAAELIQRLEEILPVAVDKEFVPATATLNIGTIRGGSAVNIIAEHCELVWEVRPLPGQGAAEIMARLHQLMRRLETTAPGIHVENETVASVPALDAGRNEAAAERLLKLTGQKKTATASFATEGGIYQAAGIPSVICGPGEVTQAHQPDERVSLDAMERFDAFLRNALEDLFPPLKKGG